MIRLYVPDEIRAQWGTFGVQLASAIRDRTIASVLDELLSGRMALFAITEGDTHLLLVVEMHGTEDGKAFSLVYLAGRTGTRAPRQWTRNIHRLMGFAQDVARQTGCNELRLGGRDWSRIFPEWECVDEARNILRTRL